MVCVCGPVSSGGVYKHPVSMCLLALLWEEAEDVKSGLVSPSWQK